MIKIVKAKKRLVLITTLMLTSLITIGICSMSYAVWNNNLTMETEILTGCLDINFDHEGNKVKNLKNIELVPFEPVRIQLSDDSTIPSKFAKYESDLKSMGVELVYSKDEGYIELILQDDDPSLKDKTFNIELLFEQDTH